MSVTRDKVVAAVAALRDDDYYFPRVRDRWITVATFARALRATGAIDASLDAITEKLSNVLGRHRVWVDQYELYDNSQNICGINRVEFSKSFFYYLRSADAGISQRPNVSDDWRDRVLGEQSDIINSLTNSTMSLFSSLPLNEGSFVRSQPHT